ncbi:hypothetical protein AB833_31580 [Chromatiales bacterium (ex Bugula neritina AB1)]|nr:hypothetical protein AB833_31580 [Chromatiales bacterium (ex Bugula neritina AB1)]
MTPVNQSTRRKSPPPQTWDVSIAADNTTMNEIRKFRREGYKDIYPTMDLDNDYFDRSSLVFYTRGENHSINSTGRLSIDSGQPFPQEIYLSEYRSKGWSLMEWGRFIIDESRTSLLKRYYQALYSVAMQLGGDAIVMSMQPRHIRFHQNRMGIRILERDTGETYGGKVSLACVVWELKHTQKPFFDWIGATK